MLSQITTKSFNVFLNNDSIVSAKCRSTGRFVKRAVAQVELNAELKLRSELKARAVLEKRAAFAKAVEQHHIARVKARLNMQAKHNVNKVINNSLVEKTKVQMQASIAKVAMLGMVTLTAFNFV